MKTPQEIRIENLERKLNSMVGKTFFHKDKLIKIIGFKIFTTAVTIVLQDDCFSLEIHLVENYLNELSTEIPLNYKPLDAAALIEDEEKPAKCKFMELTAEQLKENDKMEDQKLNEENVSNQENHLPTKTENTESATELEISNYKPTKENVQVKEALMDMLKKVTANANAIPQAKAVCDIANTMVNIQKNEIQLIQMVNRVKKD